VGRTRCVLDSTHTAAESACFGLDAATELEEEEEAWEAPM
jgi:hypothetical protein